jgi:hypothetical protein
MIPKRLTHTTCTQVVGYRQLGCITPYHPEQQSVRKQKNPDLRGLLLEAGTRFNGRQEPMQNSTLKHHKTRPFN